MRAPLVLWPRRLQWLPGLLLSVPLALLLWALRGADEGVRTGIAAAALVLALPWVIPAMVLVAALSVPVYMWLHTQGPVPPVLEWLGGMVLIGAVVGAHINAALGWMWMQRGKAVPEPGIGDFLKRRSPGARQRTDDAG
ncbi:MAG TPA: hypothetical protein VFN64_08580 [Burkholderiaceae bacterium]|nr:hypothetical protein [Burkholderiaceae bacterium]